MRMPAPIPLCLLVTVVAAQDPMAARVERDAAFRHYATVEAELRAAAGPLDPASAARRAAVLDHLRDYRERGDFGRNPDAAGARVPLFVDADGRRCAVAWLLDRTGHGELTLSVAGRCNEAWVAELAHDPALQRWLAAHGLTAAEAARIQLPPSWAPDDPVEPPPPERREPRERPQYRPGDASGKPATPAPTGGASPSGPTTGGPSGPPAARTPSTGGGRGVPLDGMEAATWLDWWEWNRGAFELPQPLPTIADRRTAAGGEPRRAQAEALLGTLANAAHPAVRAAAVQALGRVGAAADTLRRHLDDNAREVRLMALLGLGSAGSAAHVHALASAAQRADQGETLAVALAAMAVVDDKALQRALAATVVAGLADTRPSVQAAAALAAWRYDDVALRDAVRTAARTGATPLLRAAATQGLAPRASDADVAALTTLANERSVDVRRAASLALGRSRHRLALPALQTAFELEHEQHTRALQLLAIGDHGGDASLGFLQAALDHGGKTLRGQAALALGLWGRARPADATAPVAARIARALADENNRDQHGAYLLALGLLRHGASRELLLGELRQHSVSAARGAAAAALGLLGDRAALPALAQALLGDSCPWVRTQAARSLAALGTAAIEPLANAMRTDPDAGMQRGAAWALGGIADARAATALLAFAADDTAPAAARAGATLALGRHFRRREPVLPSLRFQHHHRLLPAIVAWAYGQEL